MSEPQTRVLIVDDDENQRSALARMIAALGYDTDVMVARMACGACALALRAHARAGDGSPRLVGSRVCMHSLSNIVLFGWP